MLLRSLLHDVDNDRVQFWAADTVSIICLVHVLIQYISLLRTVFLPPMWREETEHTKALYNSTYAYMLPNTLLNVLPAAYNCQPVNT